MIRRAALLAACWPMLHLARRFHRQQTNSFASSRSSRSLSALHSYHLSALARPMEERKHAARRRIVRIAAIEVARNETRRASKRVTAEQPSEEVFAFEAGADRISSRPKTPPPSKRASEDKAKTTTEIDVGGADRLCCFHSRRNLTARRRSVRLSSSASDAFLRRPVDNQAARDH